MCHGALYETQLARHRFVDDILAVLAGLAVVAILCVGIASMRFGDGATKDRLVVAAERAVEPVWR